MKILSITAQKPHSTGSGTYLTELVRAWDRAGHEQAVVYGIYPDDKVSFPDKVSCHPVYFSSRDAASAAPAGMVSYDPSLSRTPSISYPIVGMSDIMPYESTLYRDMTPQMIEEFEDAFISVIGRAIDELDPDIIVCHHLFLLTALVHRHFSGRCIAGISHGTDLRQMHNCDDLRDIVRPEIAGLDHIFALHEEQRMMISDIFGVDPAEVHVLGSGYNDSLFNTGGRSFGLPASETGVDLKGHVLHPVRICYAGKMSRPKGVPELLDVLNEIICDPDMPDIAVTLAGGCQDDKVRPLMDQLPAEIKWLGQIPQTELADMFRHNDIFVLPSYFEGLPLVLIEAMASGLIPVSTDLPGVREWLEDNVADHNVRFVSMPEMAGIDTPTEEGRRDFVRELYEVLAGLIQDISSGRADIAVPDTSGITWAATADRLLRAISHR